MRRLWWFVLVAALTGCSTSEEAKKSPAPKQDAVAPDVFRVDLDTTKGPVVIEVIRTGRRSARSIFTSWSTADITMGTAFFA
jgi:hypothetical protein